MEQVQHPHGEEAVGEQTQPAGSGQEILPMQHEVDNEGDKAAEALAESMQCVLVPAKIRLAIQTKRFVPCASINTM